MKFAFYSRSEVKDLLSAFILRQLSQSLPNAVAACDNSSSSLIEELETWFGTCPVAVPSAPTSEWL